MLKWVAVGLLGYVLLNVSLHKIIEERDRKAIYEDARRIRLRKLGMTGQHLTEDDLTM